MLEHVDKETRKNIDALLLLYVNKGGDFPIDIKLLTYLLGKLIGKTIELYQRLMCARRGFTMPIENGFAIEICSLDLLAEKRFTVGHEIGHILHTFDYSYDGTPRQRYERRSDQIFYNKKEENICDEIAGYILCPSNLIEDFLKHFDEVPCQPDLFLEKQKSVYFMRMNQAAKKFGIPYIEFCKYIKSQFRKEELIRLAELSKKGG